MDFRCKRLCVLWMALAWLVLPESVWAGGDVEVRDGRPVIRVVTPVPAFALSDIPIIKADIAAVRLFQQRFGQIFRERYLEKYKADPAKYGNFDWDKVEVVIEPFTALTVEGVETDLLAIAGDMAPDVLYVNFRKSDNYIRNGFLYPLDKPEDGYLTAMSKAEVDQRIHPRLWEVIDRKGPGGQKHIWAMPFGGMLGSVLAYRRDVFDQRKIPYPTEHWTWDDLIRAAKELTDPAKGRYGIALGAGKVESWLWLPYLWSAGGEVMVYDEPADSWRCTFDTPEAITALDFYTRLTSERWVDAGGQLRRGYAYQDNNFGGKWDRGEIGMVVTYMDEKLLGAADSELIGMVPVPLGPTGIRGAELNSRMMGLYSGIRHPAVRDAAWEFIRFFDSEEAMALKTRVMVESGYGQFVNPKYLRQFGYAEVERLAPPGLARTYEIAIQTGKPEPYGRNSNFAYELMSEPLQRARQLSFTDQLPQDPLKRRAVLGELLKEANARANEVMIGLIPPEERTKRRTLAIVVLGGILLAFGYVFWNISRVFSGPKSAATTTLPRANRHRMFWAYLLLLPALATIFLWQYLPLGMGSVMAFQDYRLIGRSAWVGLDHFGDLIVSGPWWQAVYNSLRYSLLVIALTFLSPILLAILLQEVPRGKILFRTIFYLPAVVTGLVVTLLWKQFYEPSEAGTLNAIVMSIPAGVFLLVGIGLCLAAALFGRRMWQHEMWLASLLTYVAALVLLGAAFSLAAPILMPPLETWGQTLHQLPGRLLQTTHEPYRWIQDSNTAMLACVMPMVWAGIGPGCLIYLAALKGIPDDYYEAADLDGANFIDKILFVVFPILKPLIVIQFVGAFIGSIYGASSNILAMTGGGANTEVADLHIWYRAFTFLNFGSATAMAWMLGFLLIGFTVYQLRILSRMEFKAAAGGKH